MLVNIGATIMVIGFGIVGIGVIIMSIANIWQ